MDPDLTKVKLIARVSVYMTFFGLLFGLVSVWWWALAGMSEQVGAACALTSMLFTFVGGMGWFASGTYLAAKS